MLFIAVFFVLSPRVLLGEREEIWGFQVFLFFPGTEQHAKGSSREWDLGSVRKHNSQMKRGKKATLLSYQFFLSLSLPCALRVEFLSTLSLMQCTPLRSQCWRIKDQIDPEIISDINGSVKSLLITKQTSQSAHFTLFIFPPSISLLSISENDFILPFLPFP